MFRCEKVFYGFDEVILMVGVEGVGGLFFVLVGVFDCVVEDDLV